MPMPKVERALGRILAIQHGSRQGGGDCEQAQSGQMPSVPGEGLAVDAIRRVQGVRGNTRKGETQVSELAEHHAARDRIVMEIINKCDEWDGEELQLAQQHQNDIAWRQAMKPKAKVKVLRQCAESDSFRYIVEPRYLTDAASPGLSESKGERRA